MKKIKNKIGELNKVKQNVAEKTNSFRAIEISPDKYFYLVDGNVLTNLKDLTSALKDMKKEIFNYHVTKDKNDFANWIENVFENKELAIKIRKIKTAKGIFQKIK